MKKYALIAIAAMTLAGVSGASAQTGDNPGGRGVTSTGGSSGITGKEPTGKQAPPAATTGSAMRPGTAGGTMGNNSNSMGGTNSPSGSANSRSDKASSAGGGEK